MGWTLDHVQKINPAQDGEKNNTHLLRVLGNGISDTITLYCNGSSICMEITAFKDIYDKLVSIGAL